MSLLKSFIHLSKGSVTHCHAASLVVELDGEVHLEQKEYDAERDCVLSQRGLRILRFENAHVMDYI